MSKILEKAQELGELLVDSEEYSTLEKAETVLESDQEAVELLDRFEEKQQKFATDRSNDELKEELQSLQKEMLSNEKVNNYFQSQKQFNQLMNSVNGEISNILNPDQGCSCGGNC
ncbi:UPF0342 protein BC_0880 [Halanaerobium saccharolyticum subsp. saccharolyticum DSM 6643]|uniref:UPF0342 protein BC_0880 n=1 Tax=Halanaerobium saccharolyticum subsp. saccharolyticum DSM 6643 TaxID=1293054 RepID=M5E3H2_9FIRM|nr:YlbF family regulator [Halanaerobium saccharolyticum]CCU80257.1 UPF0342 protein BC_0880 [Halanaerobium saccharolyticum subsp. saccharolyticum DSM 6643]